MIENQTIEVELTSDDVTVEISTEDVVEVNIEGYANQLYLSRGTSSSWYAQ